MFSVLGHSLTSIECCSESVLLATAIGGPASCFCALKTCPILHCLLSLFFISWPDQAQLVLYLSWPSVSCFYKEPWLLYWRLAFTARMWVQGYVGEMYVLGSQWPVLGNTCKYHFNQSELYFLYRMLCLLEGMYTVFYTPMFLYWFLPVKHSCVQNQTKWQLFWCQVWGRKFRFLGCLHFDIVIGDYEL